MTFEQAVRKVHGIGMRGEIECMTLLRQLEALGILKFDEPPKAILLTDIHGHPEYHELALLQKSLAAYGYRTVRIDSLDKGE